MVAVEEVGEQEEGVKDQGGQQQQLLQWAGGGGGGPEYNGGQQEQQCDDNEAAAIDHVRESWHPKVAELDEFFEFLADELYPSRRQDGDCTVGVLADSVGEQQPSRQYGGAEGWAPTFPISAHMADKLRPKAATPPTPSGSGTAAPELTRAASSSAATTSSMRSPGTPRAAGEAPPLHPRRFRCTRPGCTSAFKQRRDLMRHVGSKHDNSKITCPRCGRHFKGDRRDNLLRHLKIKHSVS